MGTFDNPYQMQELRYPTCYHEEIQSYALTQSDGGTRSRPSRSPFPRVVDLWFLAICMGVKAGKRTTLKREDSHKFHDGTILTTDSWRIELISLLAIGYTGNHEIVKDPREVIQLMNELAATGIPDVLQMLKEGHSDPIYNISDQLASLLK